MTQTIEKNQKVSLVDFLSRKVEIRGLYVHGRKYRRSRRSKGDTTRKTFGSFNPTIRCCFSTFQPYQED